MIALFLLVAFTLIAFTIAPGVCLALGLRLFRGELQTIEQDDEAVRHDLLVQFARTTRSVAAQA